MERVAASLSTTLANKVTDEPAARPTTSQTLKRSPNHPLSRMFVRYMKTGLCQSTTSSRQTAPTRQAHSKHKIAPGDTKARSVALLAHNNH